MTNGSRKLLVGIALIASSSTPLAASETGIAAIHAWQRVGAKTCIASHWHHGEGTGTTRKEAEAKAIKMWVDFTGWDYGTDWMSYRRAESKASNCERSGAGWKCAVDARACKLTKR